MNSFIISGYGFLAEITLDEQFKPVFKWVPSIREAKRYTSKQAKILIEKHQLKAFVWNPFKEEPIRDKWEVVRRREYHDFINDENHEALEWRAIKVKMQSDTDVKFLTQTKTPEYFTQEQAISIARERNQVAINELIEKNKNLDGY